MRRSSTGKKEGRKACVLWCLRKNALLCLITDLVSFSGVLFSLASFSSWSCLFFCYSSTALAGGYSCVTLTLTLRKNKESWTTLPCRSCGTRRIRCSLFLGSWSCCFFRDLARVGSSMLITSVKHDKWRRCWEKHLQSSTTCLHPFPFFFPNLFMISFFLSRILDLFPFFLSLWIHLWLADLMHLFVTGRDQSAADQPNNLAVGHPPLYPLYWNGTRYQSGFVSLINVGEWLSLPA